MSTATLLRITTVNVEGLKSLDGAERFGARTLVTGPMGAGKTRLSDAVRFALLGYVPTQGKREADTARLMRGSELRVGVTLDDGRWFERALIRKGQGFRMEARASWIPVEANVTEHAEAIRSLAGASDLEAEECLDLRALLSASPNERAKRIEAILDATALSPDDQRRLLYALPVFRLNGMAGDRIPEAPEQANEIALSLAQALPAAQREALTSANVAAQQTLAARGVAEGLTEATRNKNAERERVRGKTQARKEIEDRVCPAPAVTLDALGAQRQERTDRLAALRSQIEAHTKATAAREAADTAARLAQEALDALNAEGLPTDRIAALRAEAEAHRTAAGKVTDPAPAVLLDLAEESGVEAERWMQLEEQARELEDSVKDTPPAPAPLRLVAPPIVDETAVMRAEADLVKVQADPWTQAAILLADLDRYGFECEGGPLANAKPYKDLKALVNQQTPGTVAEHEQTLKEARDVLAGQRQERERVLKANADLEAIHAENVKGWEALQAKARETRQEAGELRKRATSVRDAERARVAKVNAERKEANRKAQVTYQLAVDAAQQERKRLLTASEISAERASSLEREWTAKAAALAEARARQDGIAVAAPIDLDAAAREQADLERQVVTIDEQRRQVQAADARRRELSALATELATAQASAEAWTAIEWALQQIRARDLSARGGPLVERMQAFLTAAGRPEIPFLRASKGRVDFGWRRGDVEIPIEALSGGETVLCCAALAGAILALRKPALRVLLIEAAELGLAQADALMAGCEALAEDVGTVLVATLLPVSPREGWTHIEVEAAQAATTGAAA